jgi:CRISPR system Cascade subunit CasB
MDEYQPDAKISSFIEKLGRLNPGERARLKRCAGLTLGEARSGALGLFYSLLPHGVPQAQEEFYFLVASLHPMVEGGDKGDLGASLRRARSEQNAPGLDRRVTYLLDADQGQLPFRLRQAVRFLQSNRVSVNWPLLLSDLLFWSHAERRVQRRWARSYFG